MPTSKPKPRKAGRPPLPKGSTKGEMLRIRVTADERAAIEKAAKAKDQTVSEWLRSKLPAMIGA
jgi:hypothetical protein